MRQMGEMLLAPLVDAVWDRVDSSGAAGKPRLRIAVEES
ncbi:TetR family transcriptional regulator [Mycolicibacterium vulneris]|nr:TetR family transcriptional regulator [Mycolicibacterium vulneris]